MGADGSLHEKVDLDLEWKPRRWSEHWFSCFGDLTGSAWQGCCLAYWLPCVAFGRNSRKVLGRSFWLEALKYLVLISLTGLAIRIVQFAEDHTCPKAAADDGAYLSCLSGFLAVKLVLGVIATLCGLIWAFFVGGPRRRQLREALGIPITDPRGACCTGCHSENDHCNSDCCVHFWCTCCALAQETRTILDAEKEAREARKAVPAGYVPLITPPTKPGVMERCDSAKYDAGEKLLPV